MVRPLVSFFPVFTFAAAGMMVFSEQKKKRIDRLQTEPSSCKRFLKCCVATKLPNGDR
jgi:hypothetical protein